MALHQDPQQLPLATMTVPQTAVVLQRRTADKATRPATATDTPVQSRPIMNYLAKNHVARRKVDRLHARCQCLPRWIPMGLCAMDPTMDVPMHACTRVSMYVWACPLRIRLWICAAVTCFIS